MSPYVAHTSPYPWPYDGDLAGRRTALVVLAGPGTVLDAAVAQRIAHLARALRAVGGTVVLATTARPVRPAAPGQETLAADLLDGEAPDHRVVAGGLDAFYGSDLDLLLRTRGVVRLLLAGSGLETSVHSTLRDANDRGYECLLVVDACVPIDPALTGAAVSMVEMSGGIFGAVGRAADVLESLRTAGPAPAPVPVPS